MTVRLVVMLDSERKRTPLEQREHFIERIRESLLRADGRIDHEIVEEYWRALPPREVRQ